MVAVAGEDPRVVVGTGLLAIVDLGMVVVVSGDIGDEMSAVTGYADDDSWSCAVLVLVLVLVPPGELL